MPRPVSLCVLLLLAPAGARAAFDDESTSVGVNARHTNALAAGGPTPPLERKWSTEFGMRPGHTLLAQDKIFATTRTGEGYGQTEIRAYDRISGRQLWSRSVGGTYWVSEIGYDDGRVFGINHDGVLRALDSAPSSSPAPPAQSDPSAGWTATDGLHADRPGAGRASPTARTASRCAPSTLPATPTPRPPAGSGTWTPRPHPRLPTPARPARPPRAGRPVRDRAGPRRPASRSSTSRVFWIGGRLRCARSVSPPRAWLLAGASGSASTRRRPPRSTCWWRESWPAGGHRAGEGQPASGPPAG